MAEKIINSFDVWITAQGLKSAGRLRTVDNISIEGIARLRQLILGLAMRGKLTPVDLRENGVTEQEIEASKVKYYKKSKAKPKEYRFDPPLLDEFEIPNTWKWKRVGELCDLQTGATPSTQRKEYYDGEIRWLVSGDINKGVIEDCQGRISEEGLKNSNCKILPVDTVLIALNGQGKTRATVALLKVSAACNQSLVGMIPFDSNIIDSRFLLLTLRLRYYEIRDITGQKQRRGLNMGLVSNLSMPLPPINQQKQIVAKVNELMALCDELEKQETHHLKSHQLLVETLLGTLTQANDAGEFQTAWSRLAQHFDDIFTTEDSIDQLKQTILQLAVMGKLVPQDPNDEPASELLNKIEKDRPKREGKIKKHKQFPTLTAEEKFYALPMDWLWCRFGMLGEFINGDRSANYPNKSEYVDKGVAWINTGHIEPNGTLSTSSMNYITRKKFDSLKSGKILPGDLVYCLRGATFGKSAFVTPYAEGAIASSLMIIRLSKHLNSRFVYYYLKSPFAKQQLERFDNGSAQPNLAANDVVLYSFPLPPIRMQGRIVAKVDELFALCDRLKGRIEESQKVVNQMAEAVLQQVS